MPVVIPASPGATSTAQTLPALQVFDYLYMAGDPTSTTARPVPNAEVQITLQYDRATSLSPITYMVPITVVTKTDANGYWSAYLVPNDALSPSNTCYSVRTPYFAYQISVPSGGGPYKSSSILANAVSSLPPATTNVVGPLSVAGLLTAQAGLTVSAGDLTVSTGNFALSLGGFSMAGPLTLTSAASRIVPGATSLSVRDTGNANDNLLITNAGAVTVRNGLTVAAGGLTVAAGGVAVTGNSTIVGTLGGLTGLTVASGGLTVTGAPDLTLGTSASRIKPGATSLSLRNNANTADNLLVPDNGRAVFRNGLALLGGATDVPAGTLAYAQVTANQTGISAATDLTGLTVTVTPGSGRRIRITVFVGQFQQNTAAGNITLTIQEGATVLATASQLVGGAAGGAAAMGVTAVLTPTNASHTYKATVATSNNTVDLIASATKPAFFLVEDTGT